MSGESEDEPACGRDLEFSEVGEGEAAEVCRREVEAGDGEGEEAEGREEEWSFNLPLVESAGLEDDLRVDECVD